MSGSTQQQTPMYSRSVALTRPLRVLYLETVAEDAALVERALADMRTDVVVRRVESEEEFERGVLETAPDAMLIDRPVLRQRGPGSLARLRARRPATPLILLVSALDEDTFVDALREPPDDIVVKSNSGRLPMAIERGIASRRKLAELSPRQLEVLVQVAEGLSTREIAELRGLSVKTVESHRSAMMRRIGVHDVAGLVRYAAKMGLVAL
jgi:DNA-binding NarL/FixJ family response regulator